MSGVRSEYQAWLTIYLRLRIGLTACMQTKEFEMHASTKIIVVTGLTTELHAGRQWVHFSILQPFLLTTYSSNHRLEDIVSDK